MSKWPFGKKKRQNQEYEVVPWGQGSGQEYERFVDTTRSSLFAGGDDDWDLTSQKPVFSPRPEGSRGRTYEDFLRARSSGRSLDGPYGASGYRRFYDEEEDKSSQRMQRIMQLLGSVALIGLLYFAFHSNQPTAMRLQAFVKNSISHDSNVQALSGWWQQNVSDKVALPTVGQVQDNSNAQTQSSASFVMPVQGIVKTPYDGTTQQGITFQAAAGAKVVAAGDGVVETVQKDATNDYTVTINNGTLGNTIYRHLATVSVKADDWVTASQSIGQLTSSGSSAQLFFAYQKDGSYVNPDQILNLPSGE